VWIPHLGRDLCALAEPGVQRAEPLAENDLARSATVGICSVEPPKPDTLSIVEQLQRDVLAVPGTAMFWRRPHSTEVPAAEPDVVDVDRT
jgi:hypothetical protein